MIVDTSAIVAILRGEPDAEILLETLLRADDAFISAGTYLETAVVVDANHDPVLSRRLDDLLGSIAVRVEPLTERQAEIGRRAFQDFGKGSGHPAGLNLGDCFAYALARARGEPLLFKGDDLSMTDVQSALRASAEPS